MHDEVPATIGALLDRAATNFGDRTAYSFSTGEQLSFRGMRERTDLIARGLIATGVKHGDRVSAWSGNSAEWIYLFLAAARIGAVLVPVNNALNAGEAAYIVGQSDSRVLAVGAIRAGEPLTAADMVLADARTKVDLLIALNSAPGDGYLTVEQLLVSAQKTTAAELAKRASAVNAGDVVLTLYTSGTTGFPKGAMHTHEILRNLVDAAGRMQMSDHDVLVLYLPLFHVFAVGAVLNFLYCGGRIVLMDSFDAEKSLSLMEAESATMAYGVGTMFYDQVNHPSFSRFDLSSMRMALAPGAPDLVRLIDGRFGRVINGYGMTETASITTLAMLDDDLDLRAGTVGRPLPGFTVRIVDSEANPVEVGEPGELLVRGHPVMLGYYGKPDETEAVLDSAGWFRTGDLVTDVGDGYLRFIGRLKDMLRVGGENVDPAEVEAVLTRHEGVALAAVVGLPDIRMGEVPAAWVQAKDGYQLRSDDLVAYAQQHLARFKVPRRIEIVPDFPKTGSGKIQKFRIAEIMTASQGIR
jgi:fatty-acyl-CoA synthase